MRKSWGFWPGGTNIDTLTNELDDETSVRCNRVAAERVGSVRPIADGQGHHRLIGLRARHGTRRLGCDYRRLQCRKRGEGGDQCCR